MQHLVDNRYRVVKPLGSGGMADVYLAHDDVLDRDVALKVMSGRYSSDDEFVERFRREAQSAAALSHPNIVSIYDRGESEGGTYYIAMEYLPGGTLKDHIVKHGALSARTASAVALQIACALQAAHRRDVIHRDIKPHNILITDSGDIKVTDFGIARAATSSTMTRTGSILGTAHYISPEQAMGDPAGPESDLYSLGVVLYEMLTGELPYDADTPIGIAMKHVNGPLHPPIELDPSIPEGINAITVRLLAKSPEERYDSDADLIDDLERVSKGLAPREATTEMVTRAMAAVVPGRAIASGAETTRIPPPSNPRRKGDRSRGMPPAMILFMIAILALLAWAAYAIIQNAQEETPPPKIEVQDLKGMTVDEARVALGRDFGLIIEDEQGGEEPLDTILSQKPGSNARAAKGSDIKVVIVGTQIADVPDVTGKQSGDAERELKSAGFKVNVEEKEAREQEGAVIAQDPSGGKARVDSEVTITVSTGPPTVEMPSVLGKTPAQAAELLSQSNLVLGSSSDTQPSDTVAEGSILKQKPKEGDEVEEG
ncbi:MAG: Stk1 family PASTA domain-containing Ser/Thr kinase, partial [Rubrobacter sp.]|nr:Stk1 family PASTA domain-containing Ser/Thr kinase [Rubrobacter sp.]